MTSTAASPHPLLSGFTDPQRDSNGPAWLRELRRSGAARFEALGLPHTRLEEWRSTNVAALSKTEFTPALPPTETDFLERLPAVARLDLGGPRLVFLDGRLVRELSTDSGPDGVWIGSVTQALAHAPDRLRPHFSRRDPAASQGFDAGAQHDKHACEAAGHGGAAPDAQAFP